MAVGGSGGPKADINMTPMIDVLLVLIIIFMVITPLTPKGLEALVPQPPPPNAEAEPVGSAHRGHHRSMPITIMAINSEATDEAQAGRPSGGDLQDARRARGLRQRRPVLDFQWVAKAIDIAHGAGIDKVGLMTAKVEAGQ